MRRHWKHALTFVVVPMLIVVLGCAGLYLVLGRFVFPPPDGEALRARLAGDGMLARMTDAARQHVSEGRPLPMRDSPDGQRLVAHGFHSWGRTPREWGGDAVTFDLGGAENHYGVIIPADPTSRPYGPFTAHLQPWGDGVWFYSEVRPKGFVGPKEPSRTTNPATPQAATVPAG